MMWHTPSKDKLHYGYRSIEAAAALRMEKTVQKVVGWEEGGEWVYSGKGGARSPGVACSTQKVDQQDLATRHTVPGSSPFLFYDLIGHTWHAPFGLWWSGKADRSGRGVLALVRQRPHRHQ